MLLTPLTLCGPAVRARCQTICKPSRAPPMRDQVALPVGTANKSALSYRPVDFVAVYWASVGVAQRSFVGSVYFAHRVTFIECMRLLR